jgi:hypothetical protein
MTLTERIEAAKAAWSLILNRFPMPSESDFALWAGASEIRLIEITFARAAGKFRHVDPTREGLIRYIAGTLKHITMAAGKAGRI